MYDKHFRLTLAIIATLGIVHSNTLANQLAVFPNEDPNESVRVGNRGWSFSVLSPLSITHLGVFDSGSDGLSNAHQVGVWRHDFVDDDVYTLMASTEVPAGDETLLVDGFRFSPVDLTYLPENEIGSVYVIGAFYGSNDIDPQLNSVSDADSFWPAFYHGARISDELEFMPPINTVRIGGDGDDAGYFGPNFLFVPEPLSIAVQLIGFATVLLFARQRAGQ